MFILSIIGVILFAIVAFYMQLLLLSFFLPFYLIEDARLKSDSTFPAFFTNIRFQFPLAGASLLLILAGWHWMTKWEAIASPISFWHNAALTWQRILQAVSENADPLNGAIFFAAGLLGYFALPLWMLHRDKFFRALIGLLYSVALLLYSFFLFEFTLDIVRNIRGAATIVALAFLLPRLSLRTVLEFWWSRFYGNPSALMDDHELWHGGEGG